MLGTLLGSIRCLVAKSEKGKCRASLCFYSRERSHLSLWRGQVGGCCSRQCQWSGLDSVCHRTASGKELSLWLDPACHSPPSYEEPGAQALKPLAITLTSRLSLFVCVYLGLKLCFRIWCFFLGWFPLLFHVAIQLFRGQTQSTTPSPQEGTSLDLLGTLLSGHKISCVVSPRPETQLLLSFYSLVISFLPICLVMVQQLRLILNTPLDLNN